MMLLPFSLKSTTRERLQRRLAENVSRMGCLGGLVTTGSGPGAEFVDTSERTVSEGKEKNYGGKHRSESYTLWI